jgi:hypothetical protein
MDRANTKNLILNTDAPAKAGTYPTHEIKH